MISSTKAGGPHRRSQARRRQIPSNRVRLRPTKRATSLQVGRWPLTDWLDAIEKQLPIWGRPIRVDVLPGLTASRGKLLSGQAGRGQAVHAASFIRKRVIVLEQELLPQKHLARAILVHELFHFVWVRCGNDRRRNFGELLGEELSGAARGELGESSETHKDRLTGKCRNRCGRVWREYVCESFCDTAAWYLGTASELMPVTLARRWQTKRRRWFAEWLRVETDGLRA